MQWVEVGAGLAIQPALGPDDAPYARLLRAGWPMRRIAGLARVSKRS
jgi:hypothetical protein